MPRCLERDPAGTIRNRLQAQSVASVLRKGWQPAGAYQGLIAPRVPGMAQSAVTVRPVRDDGIAHNIIQGDGTQPG